MVNTQLLDEKIKGSGLKIIFIVNALGISRMAFNKKKRGLIPFRKSEIYVLNDLLRLTKEENIDIFFNDELADTQTEGNKNV